MYPLSVQVEVFLFCQAILFITTFSTKKNKQQYETTIIIQGNDENRISIYILHIVYKISEKIVV